MTVRHLKIFTEVCRTENITRASEALNMTQPAVTRAIRELEDHYGVLLFERIGRRLYLTEAGRMLNARALNIIEGFDSLENELRDGDNLGEFRIGAGMALGNTLLPQIVAELSLKHPKTRIQVTVSNGESLRGMLLSNRLDLALLEGAVAEQELVARPFACDRLSLILPPKHELIQSSSITLSDVSRYDLLLRERGSGVRSLIESSFGRAGIVVKPLWESSSTGALIGAVAAGIGLSILPQMLTAKSVAEGRVAERPIAGEDFSRDIAAVWHRSKLVTPLMKEALELCEKSGVLSHNKNYI